MLIELKPCPFCGSEPNFNPRKSNDFTISCWCDASPLISNYTEEGAIKAWNTRHESAKEAGQPVGWTPVFDEKAYTLAVHLKGFEAHIAGKENAKQFRDEMRMLLEMIKQPPYLSAPEREIVLAGWHKGEAPKEIGVQYLFACKDVWVCPAEWTGEDWHIHNITIFPDSDFLKDKPTHWMYLPYPTEIEDQTTEGK